MQKLYSIARVMMIFVSLFAQNALQAQKCCVECQADMKVVSDKQVLLEKIDIKEGTLLTNVNTNVYVSYRSGNAQKFWANLAIATVGVVVSTQLNRSTNVAEGKTVSSISPIVPLGVSVATLPGIWKNRPKGVPQAGLYIQHRDLRGKLLDTWEQPITKEAQNGAELLTVNIDKPLSAGTVEVYLQNGSRNEVYYWGYGITLQTAKNDLPLQNELVSLLSMEGCPQGSLFNGKGQCYNSINKKPVIEKTKLEPLILTRETQPVSSKVSRGFGEFSLKVPPLPPIIPAGGVCFDVYLCHGNDCSYTGTMCSGETIDGGGGGGGGGGLDGGGGGDGSGSGGGNGQPDEDDSPQTRNVPFTKTLEADWGIATITSYEMGVASRPNSRSSWSFESLQCQSVDVAQTSHLFKVSARSNLFVPNFNGSTASVSHNWTRSIEYLQELNPSEQVTLLPPSGDYPKHNSYNHVFR